jgi:4-hydroxybenzoate polyprenyltransferase
LWAIILSGGIQLDILVLFGIGAIIMRGAGCVINDLWDRDLDGKVERTRMRPIPSGDVTPAQALYFLSFLLSLGLIILLQFNQLTILLGVIAVGFIITYPLMKRITWWPQAFLGLTFNFGALMGWAAVTGELPWQAWVLYLSGFFWTLGYDTIYALQDQEDDATIGIKSSARWLVEKYPTSLKPALIAFYSVHFALFWIVAFSNTGIGSGFFISLLPFYHLWWQIKTLEPKTPENALRRFKSNRDYGLILCGLIILFSFISG